jgi:cell volume regulation protein A
MDVMYPVVLIASLLILVAGFTSVLAFRIGAPLLLVFLALGLLFGEDGIGIQFSDAPLAYVIGSLALAIILFDSGFGTSLNSFKAAAAPAVALATFGVLLTAGLVGVAAHLIFGLPWLDSLLIGSIVSSTDAAAVFFLLRVGGITIRERIRATLEIESGSNDPMAIFLTVTLVELLLAREGADGLVIAFVRQMGIGFVFGVAGGLAIVRIGNHIRLEAGLYPIVVIAASLAIFGAAGAIGGSGFLAVYVAGLIAGNGKMKRKESLRRFQDGLTWFAQISMFLVLGLLATPSQFYTVALQAVCLALFLTFVGRPLAVWLCLLPFNYKPNETAFVSWVGLRGATSILLAILPLAERLPSGQILFNTTFIMVLTSLLVQGWTIPPLARRLGLVIPKMVGPIEKIALELPGAAHHELVVYNVVAESPIGRGERVPSWARPSLVIRDGASMRYQYAGKLRPGDQVYLFVAPRYIRLLDRLFAVPAPLSEDDVDFFGEFVVDPNKTVGDLQQTYDVDITTTKPEATIADYMRRRLGGQSALGDRVACGSIELVVRDIDEDGAISSVGVSIEPHHLKSAQIPIFLNAREILERFRARARAKSGGREG